MSGSESEKLFRKDEGSLKLTGTRPRSREGSGGILRLDINKPRLSSPDVQHGDLPSPQPSVDRLSVTFATEEKSLCSDSSVRVNLFIPDTPPISQMEKVRFPTITDEEDSEDYSASVTAIMQRRASTRKSRRKGRRTSSPFSHEDGSHSATRRRSSVFTTSSGDTAISLEESLPQEVAQDQIFENIKLHKEVLSSVKMQPWGMRRKIKLVHQAKSYIKKHEGVLQERLAQSRSTKDMLARWNILFTQKLQHYRRESANLSNWLIPWESRIKEIESHFGSVVASYFTFLRWLFWVNLIISVVLVAFVAVPEMLTADPKSAGERKFILPEEKAKATNLLTLWDFEGVLKYSPMFYGYYTNRDGTEKGYRLPFAYFMTGLGVYVYSFVATLRKMAENSRMSKLSEKDDECIFSWKLFTGWDYMIGNAETAHNRVASIILGFKEAILEEAEKKRQPRNWKIISLRIFVNFFVIILLGASAYAVVIVVQRSKESGGTASWWRRNEITVVMSLISLIFPVFFEVLGLLEHYHPRKQLRMQLARIMVLNLLNLYSLIFALFDKIEDMTDELKILKPNATITTLTELSTSNTWTTDSSIGSNLTCYEISIECQNGTNLHQNINIASLIAAVVSNISLALVPHLLKNFSNAYNEYGTRKKRSANFTEDNMDANITENSTDYMDMDTSTPVLSNITEISNFMNVSSTNVINTLEEEYYDYSNILDKEYEDYLTETNLEEKSTITQNFTEPNLVTDNIYEYNSTEDMENFIYTTIYNILTSTNAVNNTTDFYDYTDTNLTEIELLATLLPILDEASIANTTDLEEILSNLNQSYPVFQQNYTKICTMIKCDTPEIEIKPTPKKNLIKRNRTEEYLTRKKLRRLCWETMFGQELVKLTVMDLVFTILSTLGVDFFRAIFVRVMNNCWCWDLEKQFPQYGDFKIAENILHLVNNQGMVWMGMFFSPGLTVLNLVKLAIIMYLRSWAVLTCNVPHEVVFRASRSNNFYLALLLTMLFLCVLPVGYAIVWVEPSWHCGPFSSLIHNNHRIYHIFTRSLQRALPKRLHRAMDYIASPGIVIPLLVLLVLIIYYMISLTNSLREANNDLKLQLRRERTEERRKMFQIADRRRRNGSADSGDESTPFGKWKKLMPMLPTTKSFDGDVSGKENEEIVEKEAKNKDFLTKFVRKALKKSPQADEENFVPPDDGTDTEPHDSLPEDKEIRKNIEQVKDKLKKLTKKDVPDTEAYIIKEQKIKSIKTTSITKKNIDKEEKRRSSTSSRDIRQDSISSNWSDNIPVIKISKTDSSECILEQQTKSSPNTRKERLVHQEKVDIENKIEDLHQQKAEPQIPKSGSSETVVRIKMEDNDYEINVEIQNEGMPKSDDSIGREIKDSGKILDKDKRKSSIDTDLSVEILKSSSDSTQTSQNKTESSTDYQE